MSLLDRLRGKKPADPSADKPAPTPPSAATRDELVALAIAGKMPQADADAWADECVAEKLTYPAASLKFAGAMAAEQEAANAAVDAKAKELDAARAAAEEKANAADLKRVEAEAQIKAAEKERQELADTKVKLGDAGKGIDPADAPSATVLHKDKSPTPPAVTMPGMSAAAFRPVGGGAFATGARPDGALGMGNTHPFEQELTRRAAANPTAKIGDLMQALQREDPRQYASYLDWQATDGRKARKDKFAKVATA